MDWNRVEGNWKQVKGAVKQQWGRLTDDDLTQINGSQEKLEGIIQERYEIAKDETRKQLNPGIRTRPGNKRRQAGPADHGGVFLAAGQSSLNLGASVEKIGGSQVLQATSRERFRHPLIGYCGPRQHVAKT